MSITISTKTYNQDRIAPDAITYAGPAHTVTTQDVLELKRTYPKPTKESAGVARPYAKISRSVTIGDKTEKLILTLSGSVPVGTSSSAITDALTDMGSFIALEVAGTTKLAQSLDITY